MGNLRKSILIGVIFAAGIGCATERNTTSRNMGMSIEAQKIADEAALKGDSSEDKVSLDATMDRYRYQSVRLKDDETGETKIICKWLIPKGTKFAQKICRTKEEWAETRSWSQRNVRDIQRGTTNAKCGGC